MSLEEMEATWQNQALPATSGIAPVQHAADCLTRTLLIAWGALAVVLFTFALRVHEVWVEPDRTLANSFGNLLIAAAGVVCGLFGVVWARKFAHEFRALGRDTIGCLDWLIANVKWEIRSIRYHLPVMMAVFLALYFFAKHQSISSGFEGPEEGSFGWILLLIFGVMGGLMYHLEKAFLRPRLAELEAVRKQF